MKCCRQVVSFVLVVFMIFSSFIPIFATGTSTVTLTVLRDDDILNVVIPAKLPITIDEDDNIIIPSDLAIVNNSNDEAVSVTKIVANVENDWEIVDWNTNLKDEEIGTKKIAMQFRGDNLQTTGEFDLTEENWNIPVNSSLPLDMIAKLPMQEETDEIRLATVSFTLELLDGSSTDDISMLSVDYDNGLMLPGSLNSATFNWETNVEGNTLVDVISDNPDVADVNLIQTFGLNNVTEGIQNVSVEAKSRGIATITGRLNTGETASFVVNVSELDDTIEPSGAVDNSLQDELEIGDTLTPEDITVNIPIIKPDGTTENITVTPSEIEDVILSEGKNEIEATVDANGEIIVIVIVVYVERDVDPSTVVDSISVKTNPNKTEYNIGDNFEKDGLSIEVKYQDGHSIVITEGYEIINGVDLEEGQTSVVIGYEGKSCEVPIVVNKEALIVVTIIDGNNGTVDTNYNVEITSEKKIKELPKPIADEQYVFLHWKNIADNSEVTLETLLTESITIQPVFVSMWKVEGDAIIGVSDAFIAQRELPTEIRFPAIVDGVTIKGIGTVNDMYPFCSLWWDDTESRWIDFDEKATKIIIEEGIEETRKHSLGCLENITTVVLPSTLKTIGQGSFVGCTKLANIDLPSGLKVIDKSAFNMCESLTSITLPSGLTEIGDKAFAQTGLRSVVIPNGCKLIEAVFIWCYDLETATVGTGTTDLYCTFQSCTSLKTLTLPKTITSINNNTFYSTPNLSTINIYKSRNSISGAPWGTSARVNWLG